MIHLLIDYYIPSMKERQEELDFCYTDNINNENFDKVHVFCQDTPPSTNDRTILIYPNKRNTYFDYFEYASSNIPKDDIIVLANSDMYFDDSISKITQFDLDTHVLTLTRWSSNGGEDGNRLVDGKIVLYRNHAQSQDVWIWKNPLKNLTPQHASFKMGLPGCDNKIAYSFLQMGYKPINPCYEIITYHNHQTGNASRTYTPADRLSPPYHFVHPSLHLGDDKG